MRSEETWANEEGALNFLKQLRQRRQAQVECLIGAASHSTDAGIRSNWAAISQLDQVISMMEDERGKFDE